MTAGVTRLSFHPIGGFAKLMHGDPRALGFAVLRDQLLFECGHRIGSPQWLRPCERREATQHKHENAQT